MIAGGIVLRGRSIVTISFGETRTFRLRPYPYRSGEKQDFETADGSLFVAPWEPNLRWTYKITKSKRCRGRRVSVTLRAFD